MQSSELDSPVTLGRNLAVCAAAREHLDTVAGVWFHVKQWQANEFFHSATVGGWITSFLGSQSSVVAMTLPQGATVVRTRLQVNLGLGVQNNTPASFDNKALEAAGVGAYFGLWCDPTQPASVTPQGLPVAGSEDGHWLQNNMLTLRSVDNILNASNFGIMSAYYSCDAGTYNSEGMRGPATVASAIHLCWQLTQPFETFWEDNDTTFKGASTAQIYVRALYDLTPP